MDTLKNVIATIMVVIALALVSCENDQLDTIVKEETSAVSSEAVDNELNATRRNGDILDLEPYGWDIVIDKGSQYGYKLFKNSSGDYLQKINLAYGSYLSFIYTKKKYNQSLPDSPLFPRISIQDFWNNRDKIKTLSVFNGSYFIPQDDVNTGTKECPLSYPIKQAGYIISTGSANDDGIAKKKLGIDMRTKEAWIANYMNSSNDKSDVEESLLSPFVIVGSNPVLDNRKGWYPMGRTMIGILDQDGDGKKEVLYVLTGVYKQSSALNVLTEIGCTEDDVIMLDGHNSTQLMTENIDYFSGSLFESSKRRNLPYAIFVKHR